MYSGIFLYFSNSIIHDSSAKGGNTPITGSHSVIDKPESVTLVAPPTNTRVNNININEDTQIINGLFSLFIVKVIKVNHLYCSHIYIGIVMKINNRIKKLIGTIIIPIWLIFFIGIVAILAEILLPNLNGFMVFLFYLIAGLIWVVPVLPIISWMQREN